MRQKMEKKKKLQPNIIHQGVWLLKMTFKSVRTSMSVSTSQEVLETYVFSVSIGADLYI